MLFKGHRTIGTNWVYIVRIKNGYALGLHAIHEFFAVFNKELVANLLVFHLIGIAFVQKYGKSPPLIPPEEGDAPREQ